MLQVFCATSRYTQGKNATARLGEEIGNLGLDGPPLIVGGRSAVSIASSDASCSALSVVYTDEGVFDRYHGTR
jgi:glycerol dehydrogenase-like iron-containing ADH family enzyme